MVASKLATNINVGNLQGNNRNQIIRGKTMVKIYHAGARGNIVRTAKG